MSNQNCLIIAGEKSGEEHALSFLSELKTILPELKLWGVGGDELRNHNVELIYHLKDFSSWGVSEVISKIPFYKKAENYLYKEALRRKCRVAILIDFQTFNLRLAKRLKREGIKVLYYVAPQAWAWKAYRARILEETVHTLFTILPFEKKWFKERGVEKILGVQHPLTLTYKEDLEEKRSRKPQRNFCDFKKGIHILLLPGSRNFEVSNLLGTFLKTRKLLKEYNILFGLVESPSVDERLYEPFRKEITFSFGHNELPKAFEWSDFSIAASGTVTLACALFEIPTIVAYKTSLLNEFIFYTFVNYKGFISLGNIVHEEEVFPELIQDEVSDFNLAQKLKDWFENQQNYSSVKTKLAITAKMLAGDEQNVGSVMADIIQESYL